MRHRFFPALLVCLLAAPAFAANYSYQIVEVPFAGATETELFAINNQGIAVGSYLDANGMRRGFVLDTVADSYSDYAVSGATGTRLFGINDSGHITGYWQESGLQHGFLDRGAGVETIDRPGFNTNYAWGINDAGEIAGYVFDFTSGFFITSHQYNIGSGSYSTVLFNASGSGTVTRGINDAGVQVGWSLEPDGSTPGVIYDGGVFTSFSLGNDKSTLPNDINNLGDIVGNVANLDFTGSRGFVRDTLGNVSMLDFPGAELTQTLGINDLGIVVGSFEDENENLRGFYATPIPEPATLSLLAGAGLLVLCRRK